MKNKGNKNFLSIALTVCLLLELLGGGLVATASPAPSTTAVANYGQFQVNLTADPVTDTPPVGSGGFGQADSAGRIWTDKSVTAENDGTFGVKLSALAQEYMTSISTNPGVGGNGSANAPAADVTFILDMSTSMNGNDIAKEAGQAGNYYRIEAMTKAADSAIKTVMDANPNNRVAVYSFGGAATGNHLATIMDLGHYEEGTVSPQSPGGYLTYVSSSSIRHTPGLKKGSTTYSTAFNTGGGTPTQDGIMYGISSTIAQLASLKPTDTAPKRQPYAFILSDGAAIHAKTSWYTSPSGYSFETNYGAALTDALNIVRYNQPTGNDTTGKYIPPTASVSLASTGSADIAALTILTGAYMKKLLETKYTEYNGETTAAKFYTVGLGSATAINGPSSNNSVYAWAGLDPKKVDEKKADNTFNKGSNDSTGPAVNTYAKLVSYATPGPAGGINFANAFVYSDFYTFAPTFDFVKGAFDGLASDVEATTTILPLLNIPENEDLGGGSETADLASAIVIADEIGDGFEVDLTTLRIGDAVATFDASTSIAGGTAYKFAGYGSKAVIKTVSGVTTISWYIDAEDMQQHIYRFANRTSPVTGQYTAPTNGAFKLDYKVKPAFQLSPDNVVDTAYYLNSGTTDAGAKTVAYFSPPADSPYYLALTGTPTLFKTNGIGADYVTKESLSNGRVTMELGNNGRLDLEMGIVKTGPATVQINGNIDYKVKVYNYTDTPKTNLTITSDGETKINITVPNNGFTELTFTTTAPNIAGSITSNQAEVSGIGLRSNTVDTNVTDIIIAAYTVNHYQVEVDGSNPAAPTLVENLNGTTGGTTSAVAKTYPGFTAQAITQETIAADGSTVVDIYYARILYDITFVIDPIKGTTTDDTETQVVYEGTPTAPDITDRLGYEFVRWNPTIVPVTDVATYTAQFDLTDFSINYDLDGGSVATANPDTYTVESADIPLNNPTKTGYTFGGWTGTDLNSATTTVTIVEGSKGARSYEANWIPNTNTAYTVNHHQATLDGNYTAAPEVENLNGTTGGTTNAVAKTYPGFTAQAITQETIAADGSTVVDIYYARILYDITFVIDPIKGTTTDDTETQVVYEGTPTAPDITDRLGYEFVRWNPTIVPVTDVATYTAQFDLTDFSIDYDLDGGSVATANPDTYTVESADIPLNNPTKTGYTFGGWTGTDLNSATTTVTIVEGSTGARSYEANWIPDTNTAYTVNHYQVEVDGSNPAAPTLVENLNGTTGGTTSAVAQTYTGFTAPAITQGTIAADGSTVVNIYYARALYDITFVIDPIKGTTTDDTETQVVYEGTPTAPDITDRLGYEFVRWNPTIVPVTDVATYTAQFDLTNFSINYDLDGGSVATANPDTYTVESADIPLNNPTKTGYTFGGWTGTDLNSATTTVTIVEGSTGARSYEANWIPDTNTAYTVNHYQVEVDGSNPAAPTLVENLNGTTGGTTSAVAQTYTGFTAPAITQGTIAADGSTVVNIYYARALYDITFVIDPIKGTTTDDTETQVVYEGTPTAPDITDRLGYEFVRWNPTIVPVTDVATYTAQFDLTNFSINYDLDGGSVATANPDTYTVESADIPLNNPTKTGYTFGGWTGTDLNSATTTVTIVEGSTGVRSYEANWIPNTNTAYTVNHYQVEVDGSNPAAPTLVENLTGTTGGTTNAEARTYTGFTAPAITQGTIAADGSTVVNIYYARALYDITFVIDPIKGTATGNTAPKVAYEATPTAPGITALLGYTFTGWNPTIVPVSGDATYTAQFNLIDFSITYNLDAGTVDPSNPITYTVEDADFTLTNPTKLGYTFAGWTGTELSVPTLAVTITKGSTGGRSYTATWTANTSNVALDDNGGSGGSGSVTATYDQPMPAATEPTRAGYTFVGYFDQTSGGTKYYNDDMSSAADWNKTDSPVTLYAVWTEIGNVTIQYAVNNNDYGTVSQTYQSLNPEIGTAEGSTATANAGYRFVEWQDANGVMVSTNETFVPQKDSGSYTSATYTAVFEVVVYDIIYNLDVWTVNPSNPATYTVENADFTLTNPTKAGYTFAGWTGTGLSEPTLTVTIVQGSTGDRSFTATWQAVQSTGDYIVIGTVIDDDTPPVKLPGATVQIVKGNTQYGNTAITDADGKFTIDNVPAGTYNLKITLGEKTAIIEIIIGGDEQVVQLGNVIFPYNASSALKLLGSSTPAIVIDNLHPEAVDYLLNDYGNTGFAKVEMVIERIEEATSDSDQLDAIAKINTKARNDNLSIGLYLDMIVERFYRVTEGVSWNSEGLVGQTNGLIKVIIPIPSEVQGKSGYTVYRYHGNAVNVINSVPNGDGEYLVLDTSDWTLTLYVKNFSVYAIAYNNPVVPSPPFVGGTTNFVITFDGDGGTPASTTQSIASGTLLTKPADPIRTGYTFAGWYKADGSEWNFSTDKANSDITLTAKWTIVNKDIPALDKVNHFAYMKGYPDKTFGPQKNMTRAEVTVMFARLLVEQMDLDKQYPSKFKDVDPSAWYANAIGYMEQFGIITGYVDGNFRPNATITRAEFAAIASRFDELITGEPVIFSDVADDYWAKDYISFATSKGWVKGYQDGTFKPGNYIIRAEVVSVVNRMLERDADRNYVDSNKDMLNQYVDLTSKYWAYYDIMEATNSHDYEKTSNGETWISNKK